MEYKPKLNYFIKQEEKISAPDWNSCQDKSQKPTAISYNDNYQEEENQEAPYEFQIPVV